MPTPSKLERSGRRRIAKTVDKATLDALLSAARKAALNGYCPYSRFPVGAAVLTEDGRIFAGCNVENVSYGLTICAERNAVFQAVAAGSTKVRTVVVTTSTPHATPPCGACRQVLNEFAEDAEVYCFGSGKESTRYSLAELLPLAFGPGNLI